MALPRLASLRRDLVMLAVVAASMATARTSLADHYVVPSGSMLPTVEPEDHVLVDKLAYGVRVPLLDRFVARFAGPSRGDVVVLRSPEDGRVLLKRVVAVPGDRVSVVDGALVIDGRAIPIVTHGGEELERLGAGEHPITLADGGGPDFGPIHVPDGQYLVLGDHRGDSRDGRYFGLVDRDAIFGRVEGVIARHGVPTWIDLHERK
jgi:signal peptidase I